MTDWYVIYFLESNFDFEIVNGKKKDILKFYGRFTEYQKARHHTDFLFKGLPVLVNDSHKHWYEVRYKKNKNRNNIKITTMKFHRNLDNICWQPITSKHLNSNYTFK